LSTLTDLTVSSSSRQQCASPPEFTDGFTHDTEGSRSDPSSIAAACTAALATCVFEERRMPHGPIRTRHENC